MSAPDAYTLHLLGMAVVASESKGDELEIAHARHLPHSDDYDGYRVEAIAWDDHGSGNDIASCIGTTLAEALATLLTNLGVEVPERPSGEHLKKVSEDLYQRGAFVMTSDPDDEAWVHAFPRSIRDLYAREPLTVLALLEGGGS